PPVPLPYTTLFRSPGAAVRGRRRRRRIAARGRARGDPREAPGDAGGAGRMSSTPPPPPPPPPPPGPGPAPEPGWGPPGGPPAGGPVAPPPYRGPEPIVPVGDQELAPQVVTLWRAGGAVPMALLLLPAAALGAAVGGLAWLAPVAVIALAAFVIGVLPGMRYRRWRWRLTDRALELQYGVVVRQVR